MGPTKYHVGLYRSLCPRPVMLELWLWKDRPGISCAGSGLLIAGGWAHENLLTQRAGADPVFVPCCAVGQRENDATLARFFRASHDTMLGPFSWGHFPALVESLPVWWEQLVHLRRAPSRLGHCAPAPLPRVSICQRAIRSLHYCQPSVPQLWLSRLLPSQTGAAPYTAVGYEATSRPQPVAVASAARCALTRPALSPVVRQ